MSEISTSIFQLVVLIMSASIHEYAHGWAAFQLGDPTAKDAGRLTVNPLKHLDPFGSFFLPLVLFLSRSPFLIGYAKPVPYNPYNLHDREYGPAKVAIAGPASNLMTAIFFGLFLRFMPYMHFLSLTQQLVDLIVIVVYINLLLAVFNLLPLPTLDGSTVLTTFLPHAWRERFASWERYSFFIIIIFLMFGFSLIIPIVQFLFWVIVGA